jgi:hypothetical protein
MGTPMVIERGSPFSERMRSAGCTGSLVANRSTFPITACSLAGRLSPYDTLKMRDSSKTSAAVCNSLEHTLLHWHHAVAGAHEMMRTNERVVSKFQLLDLVKPGTS